MSSTSPMRSNSFPPMIPRVFAIKHDVMDRDGWERTADEIEKKYGAMQVLVNNAGVGLQAPASTGTYKDWEWGLGVNLWGPINGIHTYVPRMLASKQGAHIITTTSTSGILPGSGAGIYTVAKIAAVGLMEELRHELRNTNIGTSAFIPGLTATNIGSSESYRPAALKNEGAPAAAPGAPRPAPGAGAPPRPAPSIVGLTPAAVRPMDPMVAARFVLDGLLNNDLFIVAEPEYRAGVEARCNALLDSMTQFKPLPAELLHGNVYRTPIYRQEIVHRRATQTPEHCGYLRMASHPEFVRFVCEQLRGAGAVSSKRMFGEAAVYLHGKVVGLVCDNQLFVKPTGRGPRNNRRADRGAAVSGRIELVSDDRISTTPSFWRTSFALLPMRCRRRK